MPKVASIGESISPSFEELVAEYKNTADHNDGLYRQLTELAWAEPFLSVHRHYVEQNKLGFGDAAFHAMWLRLLDNAQQPPQVRVGGGSGRDRRPVAPKNTPIRYGSRA